MDVAKRFDPMNWYKKDGMNLVKLNERGEIHELKKKMGECFILGAPCDGDCRLCSFALAAAMKDPDWLLNHP
jgi:hypothetical protein